MKKLGKALGGLAIVGAMAAGGSAFTNSNTVVDSVAGIDQTVVSGIEIKSVDYDLAGDGGTGVDITHVNLVAVDDPLVTSDGVSLDVSVAFNDTTTLQACGAGVSSTDGDGDDVWTYVCDVVDEDLAGVTALFVTAVSND